MFLPAAAVAVGALLVLADMRYEHWDVIKRAEALTGGNSNRGKHLFVQYGCGGCHAVKGVPGAAGLVGPPLDGVAVRSIIGGRLDNNPDNLERWIVDPQAVSPGTAMPRLGVTPGDSRDIAAFLYTRT
ncbi:MAG: c-type cytochrome [Allosphingosinicella sp.]